MHYCLSYVFSYLDPRAFPKYQLAYSQEVIEQSMVDAMAWTTIVANAVFYYPIVVFVILKGLKSMSGLTKLVAIFMMLNTPTLTVVDYIKVEFTGPHMGLLLMAIYCVSAESFALGAMFLMLSALTNQTAMWYFIPFGAYILAAGWKKGKSGHKVLSFVINFAKVFGACALTFLLVVSPFMMTKELYNETKQNLLDTKTGKFLHAAPTFWVFLKQLVTRDDIEQSIHSVIRNPNIIVILIGFVANFFVWKKTNKHVFLTFISLFSVCLYLFGYNIFEKDMQYIFLAMILAPEYFKGFYAGLFSLSGAMVFPYCCSMKKDLAAELISLAIIISSIFYEWLIKDDDLPPQIEEAVAKDEKKVLTFSETLYKYFVSAYEYAKGLSGTHMAASLSGMISTYGLYRNGANHYGYICTWTGNIEAMMFQIGFLIILAFYFYTWFAVIAATCHQEPKKKLKVE